MADFKPLAGQSLEIDKETYTFVGYEAIAMKMAYAAAGKRGTVYRLRNARGAYWALKVFKPQYRQPRMTTINGALKESYENIRGVTIWKRQTIKRPKYNTLLEQYPDLEYAVLMPWIEGDNWENYWGDTKKNRGLDSSSLFANRASAQRNVVAS